MARRNSKAAQVLVDSGTNEMQEDANMTAALEQEVIDTEHTTLFEQAQIDAVNDILEDTDLTEDIDVDEVTTYPIYQQGDKFTADDLFDNKGKRKFYASVEYALSAQESGKYNVKPVAVEKAAVAKKPVGAPRVTGTSIDAIEMPDGFNDWSKARKARFLVNENGVSTGDAARFIGCRFQQVYQATHYGKTDD
jgi:hypothetical protein